MQKVLVADLGLPAPPLLEALRAAGAEPAVSTKAEDWLDAPILVLAPARSFRQGVKALQPIRDGLRSKLYSGAPCLALGRSLHLLLERSDEAPMEGLGFVSGDAKRFEGAGGKAHMGLSPVRSSDPLFGGLGKDPSFYFDHDCFADPEEEVAIAETTHGFSFVSAIRKANTYGLQFHPHESQEPGIQLLRNFLRFAGERL